MSTNRSKSTPDSGPIAWALPDVDAPDPAAADKPLSKAQAEKRAGRFDGTDPLGRAIGPKEDPTKIKKVRDPETGKVVTPDKDTGELPSQKDARERAEAEAADDPAAQRALAAAKIAEDAAGTHPNDVLPGT